MRNWFPFSDYDFYGYLVSGFVLLFTLDFAFNSGAIMFREKWTFVEIVLAVGVAYFAGQLMASPSSMLFEHFLARKILAPPIEVMLAVSEPKGLVKLIGQDIVGRYYEPLPEAQRNKIMKRAAIDNDTDEETVQHNAELVFGPAFQEARKNADTLQRIDGFRNQYGLNRNMAFTMLVAAALLAGKAAFIGGSEVWPWAFLALLLCLGLLVRFLKFYAAFAAEVLRAYSYTKDVSAS